MALARIHQGIIVILGGVATAKQTIPCSPGRRNWRSLDAMMQSLPRPEVIITHESDLDGLVSGVLLQRLAEKLFGEKIPLEAYHYNNWRQRDLREKTAWVSDFSFETRLDRSGWVIIDHHATDVPP